MAFQVGQTVEARYWKSELHPENPPWYKGEIVAIHTLSDGTLSYDIQKEMGGMGIAFEIRAIETEPAKAKPTAITTKIVAYWSYEGNSKDGRDHARKGDLKTAQYAHEYWKIHQDNAVEKIPPSRAGCSKERSSFGQVYAFRINDPERLEKWMAQIS